jgi:predicted lipoprotein with Yx(FWY)xxD motif
MRRATLTAAALVAVLSTAACANPGAQVPVSSQTASPLPPNQLDQTVVLKASTNGQLGEVVVDGQGNTLYRFDKDTAKPPKTNCLVDCTMKWLPLFDTGKLQIDGVDRALVSSVVRPDTFERQVTIAGWPVYRYGADLAPGDAKGQGVGGVWWAITPTGKKITTGGGQAAAPPSQAAAADN